LGGPGAQNDVKDEFDAAKQQSWREKDKD